MKKTALIVAGVVLALLMSVVVLRSAEVVAQGKLLSFAGEVRQVRLLDRFDLYLEHETKKPSPDTVNSGFLTAIVAVSLLARSLLRRRSGGWALPERFFLLSALGASYLSVDEQLGLHETIGHNLGFLADLPGVRHPDDLLVAAIGLGGATFVFFFRDVVRHSRRVAVLFATGGALFAFAALADFGLDIEWLEEWTEAASSAVLLGAFAVLTMELVATPAADSTDQLLPASVNRPSPPGGAIDPEGKPLPRSGEDLTRV